MIDKRRISSKFNDGVLGYNMFLTMARPPKEAPECLQSKKRTEHRRIGNFVLSMARQKLYVLVLCL